MAEWVPSDLQWRIIKRIFFRLLLLIIFLVALWLWREIELRRSYAPVIVRVEQVEQFCHPPPTLLSSIGKSQGPLRPCSDFPYNGRDYPVQASARVSFHYRSPVDHKMHIGQLIRDQNDQRTPLKVGDRITIQLSRHDPDDVTY